MNKIYQIAFSFYDTDPSVTIQRANGRERDYYIVSDASRRRLMRVLAGDYLFWPPIIPDAPHLPCTPDDGAVNEYRVSNGAETKDWW